MTTIAAVITTTIAAITATIEAVIATITTTMLAMLVIRRVGRVLPITVRVPYKIKSHRKSQNFDKSHRI
jgi:hypothetical protein